MARIQVDRPDLIASRYDGLPAEGLEYSFETQAGIPVDGTNPLLRDLSPFTLRIVPPKVLQDFFGSDVNINLIGNANQQASEKNRIANQFRQAIGSKPVVSEANAEGRLLTLKSIVTTGGAAASGTERAVLTDVLTAADTVYQLEQILQAPPLTLLVNPAEISISHSTVQQYQALTRYGYIFERWGEGQPTMSISGSTGAFLAAADPNATSSLLGEPTSPSGVQFASKRDSAAFQNFMSLFQFYKNNGYIYDTVGKSKAFLMVGAIAIDWDQWTYVGHIESFEYSYSEEMMHRLEWSMEFVVDRVYDRASAPLAILPMQSPGAAYNYPSGTPVARPEVTPYSDLQVSDFITGTDQYAVPPDGDALDILANLGVFE